ncbi:NUDIX domain-containing protein [Pseudomonas aeruginosa]|uniref:NUDIX hydrolase n=1 Tax=Pseudomonas aeruginosa TaxID=287 RepID=UPI000FD4DED5|nr:NUDIX domain-containing protein [Pseudomonas aeruginosa]MBI8696859.1 NUDIX domain-containing protein [Pseudomonas aeruginosa]MDU0612093.1 NUDIX domain-containing protein [Pseudomonas aeruginosa]RUF15803.1 NUDIX domain-containing protein [Pseudomonas aeruginosa]
MENVIRIGCGAALIKDDKILLLQRRRDPEAGHWGMPGGKVEWMEPIEHAVRREILEEIGVTLEDISLVGVVDQIDQSDQEHWIAPVYTPSAFTGTPRLLEPEKHSDIGWFDLRDLPHPLTLTTMGILPTLSRVNSQQHHITAKSTHD